MTPKEKLSILAEKAVEFKRLHDEVRDLRATLYISCMGATEVQVYAGLEEMAEAVGVTVEHAPFGGGVIQAEGLI